MAIPKQVAAQAAQVEQIEADIKNSIEATEPATPMPEPAPPPAAPPPPPPAAQPAAAQGEDWRAKYLTLQGMFNAEVPRLQQQLRDVLTEMERVKATQTQAEPPPPPSPTATPKDIEAFGAELTDFVQRAAHEIARSYLADVSKHLAEIRGEIVTLRGETGNTVAQQKKTEQQLCLERLKQIVPDYQTIDVQPGFIAWLAEEEGFSGITRQAMLNNALQQNDAKRLAAIFNAYKAVAGIAAQSPPAAEPQPAPQPAAPSPAQQELARQVSPGRSAAAVAPAPAQGAARVFSNNEIKGFYDDVARGKYRGREAEQASIEAQINAAAARGMVR